VIVRVLIERLVYYLSYHSLSITALFGFLSNRSKLQQLLTLFNHIIHTNDQTNIIYDPVWPLNLTIILKFKLFLWIWYPFNSFITYAESYGETYKIVIAYTEMEIDIIKQTLTFSCYKSLFVRLGHIHLDFSKPSTVHHTKNSCSSLDQWLSQRTYSFG